jgi:hypothetical protein
LFVSEPPAAREKPITRATRAGGRLSAFPERFFRPIHTLWLFGRIHGAALDSLQWPELEEKPMHQLMTMLAPPRQPLPRRVLPFVALSLMGAVAAWAGPQHWGFGFSYLAALEEVDGVRRLVVYEPPLHATDEVWPSRWIDRDTDYSAVPAGGLAVGDFWPGPFSREYLATVTLADANLTVGVYEPPEYFAVRPWTLKATSTPIPVTGTILGATAGNIRNQAKDQLLVAMDDGGAVKIVMLSAPASPTSTAWTKAAEAVLPVASSTFLGYAVGDFWNENKDHVAVATSLAGATQLAFYAYNSGGNAFSLVTTDAAGDLPVVQPDGLAAADYEKDGFDVLTLLSPSGDFELRVAPAKSGDQPYDYGPEYTGKAFSGQGMPGNGGDSSLVVMTGSLGTEADDRLAVGAGRLYGYVNTDLNTRYSINTGLDAQIAFAHRRPRKDECPPYGWPALGQTVSYDINLNNNGNMAIPAGEVRLKVWVNRPNRNADTDPATCDAPDYDFIIDEPLAAYAPLSPSYVVRTVTMSWPYSLIPAGPGATWRKINLEAVGERWVVATLEYPNDVNLRNNRYEIPMGALTFHPIFRNAGSLLDRQPTVQGDPPSKEYLSRKLADAVQCMWERSQTKSGEPVLQRLWFDSYEIGWPTDQPNPNQAWAIVQAKFEGWRELDGWWGIGQGWERFNWGDGGAELHETGHLFHPIGDLYQYYVSPVWTGASTMADGTPAQIRTWCWTADSFGSGHTRISWPACELMKQVQVGARNNSIRDWESLAPDNIYVRVLDRDGNPVPGAEVKLWPLGQSLPYGQGTTGADGRWNMTSLWGPPTVDAFGRKHYYQAASNGLIHAMAQVFTVKIGDHYQDAAVWGSEELAAHSRHTYMGHSFTDTASWTWDFQTNYAPGASPPAFIVTAAVQGTLATLAATGEPGATYRVYRRWEPRYVRTLLGEFAATDTTLTLPLNMAEADSFGSGRFRAIYEVTQVQDGAESLPRSVQLAGVVNGKGLSAKGDGRLLVAANAGIANPFCQVFDGTTPYQELFYHFRFGHTANKVAPSRITPGAYFATLAASDMDPDYRFDWILPPTQAPFGYDVRSDIGHFVAKAYSTTSPYWIQLLSTAEAARFQPGDQVRAAASARVTQVTSDRIYTDALIFTSGGTNPGFTGTRLAGKPGNNAALRELQSPRGLDTIVVNGSEYVVIADTGNRRVVVWTDKTAYVTHWQASDSAARPAGIAPHPTEPGKFFVIDRRQGGSSQLYLFSFDGTALTVEPGYPVSVGVGDVPGLPEMGLAAAIDPATQEPVVLVTDASTGRVVELAPVGGTWAEVRVYTQAEGVYAGGPNLSSPSDVAYIAEGNWLRRYALDGTSRVVLLAESTLAEPTGDFDGDGDVDLEDLVAFAECLSGPGAEPSPTPPISKTVCLAVFDFDDDADVDLADFTNVQDVFKLVMPVSALSFDGVNDYVHLGNVAVSGTQLTLEAWVYPNASGTGRILDKFEDYSLQLTGANNVRFMTRYGFTWDILDGSIASPAEEWVHVACVMNGANKLIYINGQPDGQKPYAESIKVTANDLILGASSPTPNQGFLNGMVREVRIWNVARTQQQIIAGMEQTLTGNEPGLVGYWPLNEGAGQVANDLTGGHPGRLGSSSDPDDSDPTWVTP